MKALAVDTTTDKIILALYLDGERAYFIGEDGCKKHNSVLLSDIDRLLSEKSLTVRDIDVFAAVVGPGSFTGIRIGVATINALALSTQKKCVELTSLEPKFNGEKKMVLLDCKHNNYYVGYEHDGQKEYLALNGDEIANRKVKIEYLIESDPKLILDCVLKKIEKKEFVSQLKPFYLKKSSAEREE